jgi:MoaA/NifB/PqqE/SkfB family radical SAM enzyme
MNLKPGLAKALAPIRSYFDYLVKRQYRYGYSVFINICICRNNLDDVRELTELAHEHGIATDYHVVESPMTEQTHYKHLNDNPNFIGPEDFPEVDELLDWLIEKQKQGYKMTNSISRIAEMKEFMRGRLESWNCRAGQNTMIIRVDGTLAPCFPMYSTHHDWGTVENPKFETSQLNEMKKSCQPHCFSTLNHIVGFCYNDARVIKWLWKQAQHGFQGATNWND